MPRSPYFDLGDRLRSRTYEPENSQACWVWNAHCDRFSYGRINVYVPGLRKNVKLMAHVALWCWVGAAARTADELYLAYQEVVCSGLELDHLCRVKSCIYPDHLELVTGSVNCLRRSAIYPSV